MKRIMMVVLLALVLVSCSKAEDTSYVSDYLDEEIDFEKVKAFDYDRAIEQIKAELDKPYVPDLEEMYRAERRFGYGVQTDWASISSEYEFDKQKDRAFSSEASARYGKIENKTFFEKAKEYGWHLLKKLFGYSRRINENGFKGYFTYYGAKLEHERFNLAKDDYEYYFRTPDRAPDTYENFDFVDYTLNNLHKANEFGEWEELEAGILQKIQLPDTSDYRVISFEVLYHYGEQTGGQFETYFDHDEVIFQFGAFEDADQFDPIDVYGYFANERDYELDESEIELADGLQVKRYLYYGILKDIKALVYEWELDGLTYYLTVSDKRYEELDELEQYEADYIKLMESVEEPS